MWLITYQRPKIKYPNREPYLDGSKVVFEYDGFEIKNHITPLAPLEWLHKEVVANHNPYVLTNAIRVDPCDIFAGDFEALEDRINNG